MANETTKEDVVKFIEGMTVLELSELVKELEQKFGVSAAAPVAMVAAAGPAQAAQAEEKTEFDTILTGFGDQKIQVIKVVRAITGLGLKEAKDLVDGVPKPIKEAVSKDEAADIKKKIEEVGGTVEIKEIVVFPTNGKDQNPTTQQVVCAGSQQDRLNGVLFPDLYW
jgi:large subunit ribosomal protein L7/L12